MTKLALRARVVFPVAAPPIEDGSVLVENGRITRVGRQVPAGWPVEDLGDALLVPGLVNAHCHLEFSSLGRRIGRKGIPLPEWIRRIIEKRPTGKATAKAIDAGLQESLRCGVTTLAEICRTETDAYRAAVEGPRLTLFQESIGFSQARAGSAVAAVEARLAELDGLANSMGRDRLRLGVSPHAPYTASPSLIRELVSTALGRSACVSLHLAESKEELELLNDGKGPFQVLLEERGMWDQWVIARGSSPQDYLRMLTRSPAALVVHGNYLDHPSLAMMARHAGAMSLVYCPRSHIFFEHKTYPLPQALELGVRVCLGTDSRASNPDLSILSEMRVAHRLFPQVNPEAILRMGTLSGAEALRWDEVGAIKPGAWADMVALRLPTGAEGLPAELLRSVLRDDQPVERIWLGGREQSTEPVVAHAVK